MTLLHLDQVTRRYGGLHALHPLTLAVPAGARHAIIGANGAGKTTLFHLIAGTVRPTSGRITFDGRDITRFSPAARARHGIARTWQHPAVFDRLPALANVALALTRHAPTRARLHLIRRGNITDQAREVLATAGLSAHAYTPAGALPYGHRRRLELALALAARPRLLLLDEPSAGLGPAETARLAATIAALPAEVAVLLIDHNLDLVFDVAATVTVLHHGRHVTTGTPDEVRAHPGANAAYLAPTTPAPTPPPALACRAAGDQVALLRVRGLCAGYRGAPVLDRLDLDITGGETVAVLGRNGAGKTTLLAALSGLIPTTAGTVDLAGVPLPDQPHRIAQAGVAIVPQGRRLFDLTVTDHLTTAEAVARRRATTGRRWTRQEILTLLPPLRDRLHHHAAHLSGGEQQMLALARALLGRPQLLLLDEPSEGLAPAVIDQLTTALRHITGHGVTVLLAEQNLPLALAVADRIVVLDHGRLALDTPAATLTQPEGRQRLDNLLGLTVTRSNR